MRLLSFVGRNGQSGYGAQIDDTHVANLGAILGHRYADLRALLGGNGLAEAKAALAIAPVLSIHEIKLLPVIPNPDKIICVGLNYETHRKETGRPVEQHPSIFTRFAASQIAAGDPILVPRVSTALDYEGELALVIGRPGRYIKAENAFDHVAGYACYNDGSIRDWQRHSHQFTPGKNFVGTGAFGPYMVTADEISDIEAQTLTTRLNGEIMQQAKISDMIFSIGQIIEYVSSFTPLEPGDVIATGTPGGVGFKREPQVYMKPGDICEIEITKVGLLRNPIAQDLA
ncbi:5-carboxymethyl-2-hydroxymuconate isomerase [Pusillimonas sp. T2]|uniref:fumarylacetoacetate hydrolase family protein n=1 Tax=Pusillimonas sp. T2 TaxID=1548123 RepID=UPI000B94645F|nr:fumarylacetoacetate hydrolase family protein [Pusillimonas sp. T2]OXR50039.1 5-carboxymethyl-2-hydroxymuconate isomerase [Pusillimonas sp. T2]